MSAIVPTERKNTVIYDGTCTFCLEWTARLRKWDTRDALEFLALQSPRAAEISGKTARELSHAMHFVRADGEVFVAAAAVREALAFTRWKKLVRGLAAVPGLMFVAEWVYVRVAARRNSFGCSGDSCRIDYNEGEK